MNDLRAFNSSHFVQELTVGPQLPKSPVGLNGVTKFVTGGERRALRPPAQIAHCCSFPAFHLPPPTPAAIQWPSSSTSSRSCPWSTISWTAAWSPATTTRSRSTTRTCSWAPARSRIQVRRLARLCATHRRPRVPSLPLPRAPSPPRLAGVFVKYEFAPVKMVMVESRRTFLQFITSVCAIVGGIFTVAGMLDGCLYTSQRALKKIA